jgi:DNA-binding transcriptional regulator LsrR (DeoR family)
MSDGYSDRLDKAARAGWLYYVAGNSQDEVARKLGVSRQSAQRLVAKAVSSKLIKFRLDYPLANCMKLASQLTDRFDLQTCEVVPSDPALPEMTVGVAIAGATEMRKYLASKTRKVIAFGTGVLPRACVDQLSNMNCPQHHLVSMVGNVHSDGWATAYGVLERLADLTGSSHNPMPLPVLVQNPSELAVLHKLETVARTLGLCENADVAFVEIANLDDTSPLVRDGFISCEDSRHLIEMGAVGEIVGWVFNTNGDLVPGMTNERVSSAPLKVGNSRPVIGLAVGQEKVGAILGALNGGLVNGLVTDEATAQALL